MNRILERVCGYWPPGPYNPSGVLLIRVQWAGVPRLKWVPMCDLAQAQDVVRVFLQKRDKALYRSPLPDGRDEWHVMAYPLHAAILRNEARIRAGVHGTSAGKPEHQVAAAGKASVAAATPPSLMMGPSSSLQRPTTPARRTPRAPNAAPASPAHAATSTAASRKRQPDTTDDEDAPPSLMMGPTSPGASSLSSGIPGDTAFSCTVLHSKNAGITRKRPTPLPEEVSPSAKEKWAIKRPKISRSRDLSSSVAHRRRRTFISFIDDNEDPDDCDFRIKRSRSRRVSPTDADRSEPASSRPLRPRNPRVSYKIPQWNDPQFDDERTVAEQSRSARKRRPRTSLAGQSAPESPVRRSSMETSVRCAADLSSHPTLSYTPASPATSSASIEIIEESFEEPVESAMSPETSQHEIFPKSLSQLGEELHLSDDPDSDADGISIPDVPPSPDTPVNAHPEVSVLSGNDADASDLPVPNPVRRSSPDLPVARHHPRRPENVDRCERDSPTVAYRITGSSRPDGHHRHSPAAWTYDVERGDRVDPWSFGKCRQRARHALCVYLQEAKKEYTGTMETPARDETEEARLDRLTDELEQLGRLGVKRVRKLVRNVHRKILSENLTAEEACQYAHCATYRAWEERCLQKKARREKNRTTEKTHQWIYGDE
ncbi:uncharacterized protein LOC129582258 isoform X2 [Paramacrobiotus metropolitanus]|uniref:uncharacterized protein LOC129582258 isoform X2 n=1 Tax=Paramacrobiotus metropolitanus TaxID=2943436 RepID=UPI002446588D|nr:uncharacterized protein LOC129582258 isoform X2 [Paramacrobiotus metropolitanus]